MFNVPPLPLHLDSYQGWQPSETHPRIAKVTNRISAADMWSHFISKRRPVVIDGFLQDPDWKASKWTDLDYLRSTAGHVPVKIEPVHPDAGHFGTSVQRSKVRFSEFLDILQDPDKAGKWYLTTQYVEDGEEEEEEEEEEGGGGEQSSQSSQSGHYTVENDADSEDSDYEPELDNVLPAPTSALSNDFPAKPDLLGNLVLQQCNLWLGNSKEGKSSGLHHDFHDNLYILLSGYKRFLLFPPSAHRYLHPRGLIDRVHPNGLIVYAPPGDLPSYVPVPGRRQQLPIRPDGLVPSDAARWRRKARLRIKREIDERAAADAGEGSRVRSERKGKARQTRAQELAEEALLQAEAELRICRMDEEGIDPEADTSDDEERYGVDSDTDLDGFLNALVNQHDAQPETSEEEEDDDDDDDDDNDEENDNQIRRLLATLPDFMKPIALAAFDGDQASSDKLRAYIESVAEESHSETEADSPQEHESDADLFTRPENGLRASDAEDDSTFDDEGQGFAASSGRIAPSVRSLRKRKDLSTSDEDEISDDNEGRTGSEAGRSDDSRGPLKRVKIAAGVESIGSSQLSAASEESEASGKADDSLAEETESSEVDEADLPCFSGADSASEFGDVDEGEAELKRLLAMGKDQEDEFESSSADDENEPPSFSRIPPHVLHRCLNVPDDPSRPFSEAANGSAGARKKTAPASERYSLMPGCPPPIEVFLKPGQMLYLPASWYHEVTSSSLPPLHEQGSPRVQQHPQGEVHMALNYWFHPPDALDFEPVQSRQTSTAIGQGRTSSEVTVPGLGVGLGESALENCGSGTGTHERPYRDAEVWDEVAHAVAQQIKQAQASAAR